jgi:2-keto-3-deoxy-L-fuconate dehydrogenase
MFSLEKKIAVITGGGSGIGEAISILFAQSKATVYILELTKEKAADTLKKIEVFGGNAYGVGCDVSSQQAVEEVVEQIVSKEGRIDILVNNAGIAHVGNLEKTSEQDFNRIFNVNVKGAYNCLYAVVPQMKKQGGGVIVNMASIAASVGIPDRFAYSMSKGAVLSMTMSVAKDYLKDNIRCNSVSPARVHTPFVDGFIKSNYPGKEQEMYEKLSKSQPIGRMGKPEEVASLVLYLVSDEAGFITGCDYLLDGGFVKLNN